MVFEETQIENQVILNWLDISVHVGGRTELGPDMAGFRNPGATSGSPMVGVDPGTLEWIPGGSHHKNTIYIENKHVS